MKREERIAALEAELAQIALPAMPGGQRAQYNRLRRAGVTRSEALRAVGITLPVTASGQASPSLDDARAVAEARVLGPMGTFQH